MERPSSTRVLKDLHRQRTRALKDFHHHRTRALKSARSPDPRITRLVAPAFPACTVTAPPSESNVTSVTRTTRSSPPVARNDDSATALPKRSRQKIRSCAGLLASSTTWLTSALPPSSTTSRLGGAATG